MVRAGRRRCRTSKRVFLAAGLMPSDHDPREQAEARSSLAWAILRSELEPLASTERQLRCVSDCSASVETSARSLRTKAFGRRVPHGKDCAAALLRRIHDRDRVRGGGLGVLIDQRDTPVSQRDGRPEVPIGVERQARRAGDRVRRLLEVAGRRVVDPDPTIDQVLAAASSAARSERIAWCMRDPTVPYGTSRTSEISASGKPAK